MFGDVYVVTQMWLMCVEPFSEFVLLWTVSIFYLFDFS